MCWLNIYQHDTVSSAVQETGGDLLLISCLLIFPLPGSKALQDWSVEKGEPKVPPSPSGLVLSKVSFLISRPEYILRLTLFPHGFIRGFPAWASRTVPPKGLAVFSLCGSQASGTRINNDLV